MSVTEDVNLEVHNGLGLPIVRRIVELHGARLELSDNDAGHGLLVRVIWPSDIT